MKSKRLHLEDYKSLAIDGGQPVRTASLAPWPYFEADEIEAVSAVLNSGKINYWTGEEGRWFEKEFAAFTACDYAVAVANGTLALELALHALGIGSGDEVIVPSRTFIASASCVVARGAKPVVADIDPVSQNITVDSIKAVCTDKTRAIIAVHLAGWPCDMDPIIEFARKRDIKVIEDCAQAQGAYYKNRPIGSLGDAAAFSFCQDKIMTTGGEGGMLTTKSKEVWEKAWSYKDHGKGYDVVYNRKHPIGFRWLHESFGTNWRMTEMQAAIGRKALVKSPDWVKKRREYAVTLNDRLAETFGLRLTIPGQDIYHAYYKYYVFVRPEVLKKGWDRDRVMEAINAEGIPCSVGSCSEIYHEQAFVSAGYKPKGRYLTAKKLGDTSLMFLVHPTLSREDIEDTCTAIEKVMAEATSLIH